MFIRRKSYLAYIASFFAINALLVLLFAFVAHYIAIINLSFFYILLLATIILAGLAFFCSIGGFIDLWLHGAKGGLRSFRSLTISLAIFLLFSLIWFEYQTHPKVNDISTDLQNPPAFVTSELNQITEGSAIDLSNNLSLRYDGQIKDIVGRINLLAKANNWQITGLLDNIKQDNNYYVELKHKSLLTGFMTYIVVRLHQENDTVLVDTRAKTPELKADAGISEHFLHQFLEKLDDLMLVGRIDVKN